MTDQLSLRRDARDAHAHRLEVAERLIGKAEAILGRPPTMSDMEMLARKGWLSAPTGEGNGKARG